MMLKKLIKDMYNSIKREQEQVVNHAIEEIKEAYKKYPAIRKEIIDVIRKTAEETRDPESIEILRQAYLTPEVRDALKSYFKPEDYIEYVLNRFKETYKKFYKEIKKKIGQIKDLEDLDWDLRSLYSHLLSIGEVAKKGSQLSELLVWNMIKEIGRTALETRDLEIIKLMAEAYSKPEFKEVLWKSLKILGREKIIIAKVSEIKFLQEEVEELKKSLERYGPVGIITEIGNVARSKDKEKISETITHIYNKLSLAFLFGGATKIVPLSPIY